MTLAEAALRSLLDSGAITIGLGLHGNELKVEGYTRKPAARWRVDGTDARCEVTFGPFLGRADYDMGLLFIDGQLIDTLPNRDGLPNSFEGGTEFGYVAVIGARNEDLHV